jgi:large subunit ribosomal protein L28
MQKCELTGKGKQYGSNVSFSQRHTKKVWKPNLQKKTIVIDGRKVKMKISTQAIRTLKRKGLILDPKNPAQEINPVTSK